MVQHLSQQECRLGCILYIPRPLFKEKKIILFRLVLKKVIENLLVLAVIVIEIGIC